MLCYMLYVCNTSGWGLSSLSNPLQGRKSSGCPSYMFDAGGKLLIRCNRLLWGESVGWAAVVYLQWRLNLKHLKHPGNLTLSSVSSGWLSSLLLQTKQTDECYYRNALYWLIFFWYLDFSPCIILLSILQATTRNLKAILNIQNNSKRTIRNSDVWGVYKEQDSDGVESGRIFYHNSETGISRFPQYLQFKI